MTAAAGGPYVRVEERPAENVLTLSIGPQPGR